MIVRAHRLRPFLQEVNCVTDLNSGYDAEDKGLRAGRPRGFGSTCERPARLWPHSEGETIARQQVKGSRLTLIQRQLVQESCAQANRSGTVFNDGTNNYTIECGADHNGGDLMAASALSFTGCMAICDTTPGCIGYAYLGGSGAGTCYLKSAVTGKEISPNVDYAYKPNATPAVASASASGSASSSASAGRASTSATSGSGFSGSGQGSGSSTGGHGSGSSGSSASGNCAQITANGPAYTDANNQNYTVACGTDHLGGDLSAASSSSFAGCFDICDNTDKCIGFAYVGGSGAGESTANFLHGLDTADSRFQVLVTSKVRSLRHRAIQGLTSPLSPLLAW